VRNLKKKDRTAEVKSDVKPMVKSVKPEVKPILEVIKSYHDQGKEPLVSGVAEATGMESRSMGVLLKRHRIEAMSTRRDGQPGRYFTFDLRDRIGELLSDGRVRTESGVLGSETGSCE